MKILIALIIAVSLLTPTWGLAAGTCVIDETKTQHSSNLTWREYRCTADPSDGSFDVYSAGGFSGFYLYSVETWPGAVAPTDASDLTLIDATTGEDLLGGSGLNSIDATDANTVIPRSSFMSVNFYHMMKDTLNLTITGNSVNSAIINVRISGGR